MKARWFMSEREIQLCQMTEILFLTVGSIGGALTILLWPVNPFVVVIVSVLLFFIGVFVWERIARRIIGRNLLVTKP